MADDAVAAEGDVGESAAETADPVEIATEAAQPAEPPASRARLALVAGLVLVLALGGLTSWVGLRVYHSHQIAAQRAEFLRVGRQGALNLTSIDFTHVDADVQRILDSSTGTYHDDFQRRSKPFIEAVKQAKSTSVGRVTASGLESVHPDAAQVLVALTVTTSNAGGAEQQPKLWRMRMTVQKVGDDVKVAKAELLP